MEIYQQEFLVEQHDEDEDEDENDSEIYDFNAETNQDIIDNALISEVEFELSSILTVLKCAVHTLQLAVHDTMKALNMSANLNNVRNVIKKLRTPKYRQLHIENNANKVQLDVPTRWNSIYIMLDSLIANKDLYKSIYGQRENKDIEMTEAQWKFVQKYLDAFKPVLVATKHLQLFQLGMSK